MLDNPDDFQIYMFINCQQWKATAEQEEISFHIHPALFRLFVWKDSAILKKNSQEKRKRGGENLSN